MGDLRCRKRSDKSLGLQIVGRGHSVLIENVCEKDYFEVLNKISTWQLLNHGKCGVGQLESFCV
jgi:hypothetical protein